MSSFTPRKASNKIAMVQGGAITMPNVPVDQDTPVESLFGPANNQIRLAGNENPYGPAPSALAAIAASVGKSCFYADRAVYRLIDMIAERNGLERGQVVLAAGSTEILCAAAMAWGATGAIICPDLFWDAPIQYAERKGVQCIATPLDADMNFDLSAMEAKLDGGVSLVHLVNPNNPTGLALDNSALRAFVAKANAAGVTVLVDEAYNELTDAPEQSSLVDLVRAGENVVVTRTFSKIYGMAGLRVGYAMASEENIAKIRGYLTSFGGNTAGLAAAIGSYNDFAFLEQTRAAIVAGRNQIIEAAARYGLSTLPSQTNFLFVDVGDADAVHKVMAENNISIRGAFGEWHQYSRVSVGTPEDVQRYIEVLPKALEHVKTRNPL